VRLQARGRGERGREAGGLLGSLSGGSVDQGKTTGNSAVENKKDSSRTNEKNPKAGIEEVIVTAQKRTERLSRRTRARNRDQWTGARG